MDTPTNIRSVYINYMDVDLIEGEATENTTVEFKHFDDGSIQLKINGKPAICSMEMIANWAYTMTNWKRRIDKDTVAHQPHSD